MREGKPVEVQAEVGRLEDGEKVVAAATPEAGTVSRHRQYARHDSFRSSPMSSARSFKIDEGLEGAIVTEVDPDGPAAEKRIEPGDVITEAGQKPVEQSGRCRRRASRMPKSAQKKSVLLFVAKGGKQSEMRFIAVRIKKELAIDKLVAPVALQIEESGQVAVVDADGAASLHFRLGMEGHAEARSLQHRNVVGAVADGDAYRRGANPSFREARAKPRPWHPCRGSARAPRR